MVKLTFGTDNLTESARENFIGTIAEAAYPCNCDMCNKGRESLGEDYKPSLHIQIMPLTVYDKRQHEWLSPSKTKMSKWGAFNIALDELGVLGKIKSPYDLKGKMFEFKSVEVEVGFGGKSVSMWKPVRVITKDEANKIIDEMDDRIDDLLDEEVFDEEVLDDGLDG